MNVAAPAQRYQWLFFDADGTLFDFEKSQAAALAQVFRHHGISYDPTHLATFRGINAELWRALEQGRVTPDALKVRRFELLLATVGAKHAPEPFSEIYLQYLGACPELICGADGLLRTLRSKYRIAILTNGLKKVQRRRLERSAIRDYISEIIVSEEIGHAKPAREYFDVAFARAGNPAKHEVLMIGDSWNSDIQGAAQYGIDTCWYNPGRQPRPGSPAITHEIATLEELPLWLGAARGEGK
jgi:YjjG family noncanonical pyrimidine nucleotidase